MRLHPEIDEHWARPLLTYSFARWLEGVAHAVRWSLGGVARVERLVEAERALCLVD